MLKKDCILTYIFHFYSNLASPNTKGAALNASGSQDVFVLASSAPFSLLFARSLPPKAHPEAYAVRRKCKNILAFPLLDFLVSSMRGSV